MPHDVTPALLPDALVSKVAVFAATRSAEDMSKLMGFFHLADPDGRSVIDFHVDPSGRVTLSIGVDTEAA